MKGIVTLSSWQTLEQSQCNGKIIRLISQTATLWFILLNYYSWSRNEEYGFYYFMINVYYGCVSKSLLMDDFGFEIMDSLIYLSIQL